MPNKYHVRKVGKSLQFPFLVSVVCWIDLLGYGSMISAAGFNPLHPKSGQALKRIRSFHDKVAAHSNRYFRTLVVNDGAAAYRDLSFSTQSVTHDFLVKAWDLFGDINKYERENHYPGARLVLACGFRMRGRRGGFDPANRQYQSVLERYRAGTLKAEQAISEAAAIRQPSDVVPHLQANFAFTKAYVAETTGTAGGLGGSKFYVDLLLFDRPLPPWIVLGPEIRWSNTRLGLEGSFAAVAGLPVTRHAKGGPSGLRNGLEIAQQIAGDPDVLAALRVARKA